MQNYGACIPQLHMKSACGCIKVAYTTQATNKGCQQKKKITWTGARNISITQQAMQATHNFHLSEK